MPYGKEDEKKLDPNVSKSVNAFLFSNPKEDMVTSLNARTIIGTRETFQHIYFHRLLQAFYESKSARNVADECCQMLISMDGKGRDQGVDVLTQHKGPKTIPHEIGTENIESE